MKNILILVLGVFLLQACLEDSGNYDYTELQSIEIDSSRVASAYRVTQLDYLSVQPGVKQGTDDQNISYKWQVMQEGNAPNPVTGKIVNEVVGRERVLNYKVTIPPGVYKLCFTATDKQNGVSETFIRPLTIESFASVGMMVMHGDADSSDVSILVNNRIVPDVEGDYVKHNIFLQTNAHRISGAPARVAYVENTHNVYVFTKGQEGGFRTSGSDLSVLAPYSEMFTEPLSKQQVDFQAYAQWSYNDLLINDGKLYFIPQPSTTYNKFGVPCFGTEYYAEPYVATQMTYAYYGVIFDRLQKRFLYINYDRLTKPFKEPAGAAAFNMNNVGKDLLYAEHGFGKKWYCVMKGNDNACSVYVCDFSAVDDGNRGVGKYDATGCPDMAEAKAYAVGNRGEILFYATATEVKQVELKADGGSTLRYELKEEWIRAGYEITMMHLFKVSGNANEGKLLYVGIYNPVSGDGKLLEFPIVETSGEILKEQLKVYDGFKKITHMCFKSK